MASMDLDSKLVLSDDDDSLSWLDDEPISPCSVAGLPVFSPPATPKGAAQGSNPFAAVFGLEGASKMPPAVTPDQVAQTFDAEEIAYASTLLASPRAGAGAGSGFLADVFFGAPAASPRAGSPRAGGAFFATDSVGLLEAASAALSPAAKSSPAALKLAEALGRGVAARAADAGLPAVAHACHALVERCATLPPTAAQALAALAAAQPLQASLGDLATFVGVAAQEAAGAVAAAGERRSAWRPLAIWRARQARASGAHQSAAAALQLWADLAAAKPFDARTRDSRESRAIATALAHALSAAVVPAGASSTPVAVLRALGADGNALVKRAHLWSAVDARTVVALVEAVPKTLDRLAALAAGIAAATTKRSKKPSGFAPTAFATILDAACPCPPPAAALPAKAQDSRRMLEHVVANAQGAGRVLMTGCDAYAYDAATFAATTSALRLGRVVAAALQPASTEDVRPVGPDGEAQFLWRVDAAALPHDCAAALATPKGLAAAVARDGARVAELQAIVDEAERAGEARAGWLGPVRLEAVGSTVELRDCVARDPATGVTAFATAVSVVHHV